MNLVLPPVQELLHVVCWLRSGSNLVIYQYMFAALLVHATYSVHTTADGESLTLCDGGLNAGDRQEGRRDHDTTCGVQGLCVLCCDRLRGDGLHRRVSCRASLHCVRHGVVAIFAYCSGSSIARCVLGGRSACTGDIIEVHVGSPLACHARVGEAVRVCSVLASSLGYRDQLDEAVYCQ